MVVFEHAFHGRTLLTMTMTRKLVYKKGFGPFAPEVYRAPAPYPYRGVSSDDAIGGARGPLQAGGRPESVACVVLEPVQGEGGFIPMPADFPAGCGACREHGILYVDDEVQSGVGRTGPIWAIEHYGVEPDLSSPGKSLGGGLPLAGGHRAGRGHGRACTRAGSAARSAATPSSCAAALAVLDEVATPEFRRVPRSSATGFAARLDELADPVPADRRGARPRPDARSRARRRPRDKEPDGDLAKRTIAAARERGLILLSCGLYGNVIRILAARSISDEDLERGPRHPGGVACRCKPERPAADEIVDARHPARAVRKTYGDVVAVDGVDLEIPRGEFFTMLGPSGSGKTTTLRLIAGFEPPDAGQILLGGSDVARQPPYERDVNTVFQDYALFPHMTVGENVAYGLMSRRCRRPSASARARGARAGPPRRARGRKPAQLSGGQRQRVALARALVNRPQVLLLDEPLGALDLKLRQEMQIELKRIQQEVGITFVYVTHDQEEALTMSDRIAVFNHGRIEQVGHAGGGLRASGDRVRRRLRRRLERARARTAPSRFTVRPEKIRLLDEREHAAPGSDIQRPAASVTSSTSGWSRDTWSSSTQVGC